MQVRNLACDTQQICSKSRPGNSYLPPWGSDCAVTDQGRGRGSRRTDKEGFGADLASQHSGAEGKAMGLGTHSFPENKHL